MSASSDQQSPWHVHVPPPQKSRTPAVGVRSTYAAPAMFRATPPSRGMAASDRTAYNYVAQLGRRSAGSALPPSDWELKKRAAAAARANKMRRFQRAVRNAARDARSLLDLKDRLAKAKAANALLEPQPHRNRPTRATPARSNSALGDLSAVRPSSTARINAPTRTRTPMPVKFTATSQPVPPTPVQASSAMTMRHPIRSPRTPNAFASPMTPDVLSMFRAAASGKLNPPFIPRTRRPPARIPVPLKNRPPWNPSGPKGYIPRRVATRNPHQQGKIATHTAAARDLARHG